MEMLQFPIPIEYIYTYIKASEEILFSEKLVASYWC